MKSELVVSFDCDGILCKGTTIKTEISLLEQKFNAKLAGISGEPSHAEKMEETEGWFIPFMQALEYARHYFRSMDVMTLSEIARFKDLQTKKTDLNTGLFVVSGRSNRLKELTQRRIEEAGFKGLFDGYFLCEPGYGSHGWKMHVSNTIPADIYCQIDDDLLAGRAVLKTQLPGRIKHAFVIKGPVTNPLLLAWAGVEPHPRLHMVGNVGQALATIAKFT